MRKVMIVLIVVLLATACTYPLPPWDEGEDYPTPPLPPITATLVYPELPWNHPCNDPLVPQLPGACP